MKIENNDKMRYIESMPDNSMKKRFPFPEKRILYPIIIFFFFLLILFNQYEMLMIDKTIPYYDWADHYLKCRLHYEMLTQGNFSDYFFQCLDGYPTLVYHIATAFMAQAGISPDWTALSQSVFWLIMLFSAYGLGTTLYNRDTGLLSAIFCFALPFVSRYMMLETMLDLPCGAMVALSVLCLYKSNYLEKYRWTLLFFISAGLSALVKWPGVFYLFPLFVYFLIIYSIKRIREQRTPEVFRLAIGFMMLFAITGILFALTANRPQYYLIAMDILLIVAILPIFLKSADSGTRAMLQGSALFFMLIWHVYAIGFRRVYEFATSYIHYSEPGRYHLMVFVKELMGPFWILFPLTGILYYIFSRCKNNDRTLFFLSFALNMLIIFTNLSKHGRFFMHILVYIAIISTCWITLISNRFIRYTVTALLLAGAFLGIFGWRFEANQAFNRYRDQLMKVNLIAQPLEIADWRPEEIGSHLKNAVGKDDTLILLLSRENFPHNIPPLLLFAGKYYTGPELSKILHIHTYRDKSGMDTKVLYMADEKITYRKYYNELPKTFRKVIVIYWGRKDSPVNLTGYRLDNFPSRKPMTPVVSDKISQLNIPLDLRIDFYNVEGFRSMKNDDLIFCSDNREHAPILDTR